MEAYEARALIGSLAAPPSIIIGTPYPERLGELGLGDRTHSLTSVSNNHVPEVWRKHHVAAVR